jgi:hypothetical protein
VSGGSVLGGTITMEAIPETPEEAQRRVRLVVERMATTPEERDEFLDCLGLAS